jgi:hypothetical protein
MRGELGTLELLERSLEAWGKHDSRLHLFLGFACIGINIFSYWAANPFPFYILVFPASKTRCDWVGPVGPVKAAQVGERDRAMTRKHNNKGLPTCFASRQTACSIPHPTATSTSSSSSSNNNCSFFHHQRLSAFSRFLLSSKFLQRSDL